MRSLPRPGITGAEALELCASSIKDEDLRDRLLLAVASVEAAEAGYVVGPAKSIFTLSPIAA